METATLPPSTTRKRNSIVSWPAKLDADYHNTDAQQVSNLIDEGIKQEAVRRKEARKREVKGKSTLYKHFQLFYASNTLERERSSWRAAIYLNIIRATRTLLEGLKNEVAQSVDSPPDPDFPVTKGIEIEVAKMALALESLLEAEAQLTLELNGGLPGRASVYARCGWQALMSARRSSTDTLTDSTPGVIRVADILEAHYHTVEMLWHYPLAVSLLARRKMRVEESMPYFLNAVARISSDGYLPTTEDILNVRIQTLGVIEHQFVVPQAGQDYTWRMYDVGGARGQYIVLKVIFSDILGYRILMMQLTEDSGMNRLEDSLQLFTAICSSKLLLKAGLILFLNKVDLLKKKLAAGRKVRKYIPSYGDRPNTYEEVSKYFLTHFAQIHRKNDKTSRNLFAHFTSMLDVRATHVVISHVSDAILRKHIAQLGLI
ncbi:hypothetical protein H0H92_016045 [Tricholoma furcatifolium]|nr:hypothetical protein H0H92_016045 [Tricholoma furcatifolium]